ncbi:GTPase Era [Candidatus Omnitrophota bacterium]
MTEKIDDNFRCGFVAVVGRPNAGKSTLVNTILKRKIAIVTRVPQTTRNIIRGIYNAKDIQIIFVDTPGLHNPKDHLGKMMNKTSRQTIDDVDIVLYLMDTSRPPEKEEKRIIETVQRAKKPIILGLNKVDLGAKHMKDYIDLWQEATGKDITTLEDSIKLLPLSSLKGTQIKELMDIITKLLPKSVPLFPVDVVSDFPQRLFIAELVREKLFNLLRDEIPYGLSVSVEDIVEQKKNLLAIYMIILVDRDSQKKIVIGQKGSLLKKAGTEARKELEKLLGKKVYLDLRVKTRRDWRDNARVLQELGLIE